MVVLPGGVFLMGSLPDVWNPDGSQERPYHPVTIAEPFAVGRYEVTFDEWEACVAEGGCACYKPEDNSAWQQGDCTLRVTRGRSFYWKDRYSSDFRSAAHNTARLERALHWIPGSPGDDRSADSRPLGVMAIGDSSVEATVRFPSGVPGGITESATVA